MAAMALAPPPSADAAAAPAAPGPPASTLLDLSSLMPSDEDLAYEEELLRNPYSLKTWLRYLAARERAPFARRRVLYERAVAALPGSYKLWRGYLSARRREVRALPPRDRARDAVSHAFERALVTMHKMPVIWQMYLEHVCESSAVTAARRAFDRALAALPLTQHAAHVWPPYLSFVRREGVPVETAVRVYRRYLQLEPAAVEEYVELLTSPRSGRWAEAARRLAAALDDDAFRSLKGRTRHALWLELCDLVTKHPREVEQGGGGGAGAGAGGGLDVEAVLRGGIRRHPEESGRLWAALADHFTRRGLFERARDVYEEAMGSVTTVRDFGLVYDALTHFEESLLAAKMEQLDEAEAERAGGEGEREGEGVVRGRDGGGGGGGTAAAAGARAAKAAAGSAAAAAGAPAAAGAAAPDDADSDDAEAPDDFLLEDARDGGCGLAADVDLRLARLELLAARRPELLSSVALRQNPHNVGEWHRRARLFAADPRAQVACLTEAVRTVDAAKCGQHGRPFSLWVALAKVYEAHGDLKNARAVFERAVRAGGGSYRYVDDLAAVWCERVEMELRHREYKAALALARRATGLDGAGGGGGGEASAAAPAHQTAATGRRLTADEERALPVQARLHRSQRLWALACDLEESLGTVETASAAYERAMSLRVATPQLVLNYAAMLREAKRWEAAFRAYERGVSRLFRFPHSADLWSAYLEAFVARYGGAKLERARDLFETCLRDCPAESAWPFYEAYARLEEAHGLARRAMDVYDRALAAVPREQRGGVVDAYLARAARLFGVPKLREVHEAAIEAAPPRDLPDADVRRLCASFAQLEARLGEVDRARGIFAHGSHLADPRLPACAAYWDAWRAFEVAHGNEDTFREMLRLKRSVAASFATLHVALAPGAAAAGAAEAAGLAEAAAAEAAGGGGGDAMAALDAAAAAAAPGVAPLATGTRVPGFVSAGVIQQGKRDGEEDDEGAARGGAPGAAAAAAAAAAANPEEIDLGGEGDEEEEEGGDGDDDGGARAVVRQRAVPAAVFGGLAAKRAADGDGGGDGGGGGGPGPAAKRARP
jgi:pre-mRNA-splicing factor SYF1